MREAEEYAPWRLRREAVGVASAATDGAEGRKRGRGEKEERGGAGRRLLFMGKWVICEFRIEGGVAMI
jgi:hypothetical protein